MRLKLDTNTWKHKAADLREDVNALFEREKLQGAARTAAEEKFSTYDIQKTAMTAAEEKFATYDLQKTAMQLITIRCRGDSRSEGDKKSATTEK